MSNNNPVLLAGGVASNQSVYEVVTSPRHTPGTRGILSDGRVFEYVRSNQGTAIGKGKLATYEPQAAGSDQLAPAAAGIGATSISLTVTISVTANELVGGFLAIESTPGEAEMYKITGHPAHTSGAGFVVQIERPIVVALTTGSDVSIIRGSSSVKISLAVVADASPVEVAAGVPLVEIPIGSTTAQYAWVQKTGLANVLFGAVVGAVGDAAYQGEVAGAFQASVDTSTQIHQPTIAIIYSLLPVDTEYFVVNLQIA